MSDLHGKIGRIHKGDTMYAEQDPDTPPHRRLAFGVFTQAAKDLSSSKSRIREPAEQLFTAETGYFADRRAFWCGVGSIDEDWIRELYTKRLAEGVG